MKLKAIAAITAALTLAGMGIAQAADPIKVYANKTKGTNVADNTLDGDFSSRWIAKGDGSFIQYQFEEAVTLEAIKIAFFKGDSRTASFRIESTDAPWKASAVWEQQALMESNGTSTDLETFEFAEPVTAKYFRIVGHGFVGKWGWESNINGITEAEFVDYQVDQPDPEARICGTSASTADGENVSDNVLDDDLLTRWSGNSDVANATLTLELCEEATLSGVSAAFHKGNERSHDFSIEVSNDNSTWTPALAQTTTANDTLETQDFSFEEEVSATYVRYTGYGNSGGSTWNSVTELTVCQDGACGVEVFDKCEDNPNDVSCLSDEEYCELFPDDADRCEQPTFCELNPDDESCNVDSCAANGQIEFNGACAPWTEPFEAEYGRGETIGEEDYLLSAVPAEMEFDALAAQHVTSSGNGWRHELKIKSSGDYRVDMTKVYELFKAKITINLSDGSKTIAVQHHASTTDTITKLYIADLDETGFDSAPDGSESDSVASNGVFDVYIRLADPEGNGSETKYLLTTMKSGESFDFELENDHGYITAKINGDAVPSGLVKDSPASYLKFGNYLQAQYPVDEDGHEVGDKLTKGDGDGDWAEFYAKYFSESKVNFTEMSYIRTVDEDVRN